MSELDNIELSAGIRRNEDGSVTVFLPSSDEIVSSLTVRRPKGADYLALDAVSSMTAKNCLLIARCAGVDTDVIEQQVDMFDLDRLSAILDKMGDEPPAGVDANLDPVQNDDGSVTLPLATSKMSEGKQLAAVTVRRVRPIDMKLTEEFTGGNCARSIFLAARLIGAPQSTVKLLDCYDYRRVQKQTTDFLGKPRGAGEIPSSPSGTTRTSPSAS